MLGLPLVKVINKTMYNSNLLLDIQSVSGREENERNKNLHRSAETCSIISKCQLKLSQSTTHAISTHGIYEILVICSAFGHAKMLINMAKYVFKIHSRFDFVVIFSYLFSLKGVFSHSK